jgi:exodeoxyribonuclease III
MTDLFRHLHPRTAKYSWVGRTGNGYRYDYAVCSQTLRDQIVACQYLHEQHLDKFSGHSALSVRLSLIPPDGLLACDLAAMLTPPTLF